jgi:hypothetical protein
VYQVLSLAWLFAIAVSLWEPHAVPHRRLLGLSRRPHGAHDAPFLIVACSAVSLLFSVIFLVHSLTMQRQGRGAPQETRPVPTPPLLVLPLLTVLLVPLWALLPISSLLMGRSPTHTRGMLSTMLETVVPWWPGRSTAAHGTLVEFRHVVCADVLTSATWLLWDVAYTGCLTGAAMGGQNHRAACANGTRFEIYAKPVAFAFPFVLRLAQCLIKFVETRHLGGEWAHWSHLANAFKYFSGICTVLLSTAASTVGEASPHYRALYRGWLAAVIVKVFVSILWDVFMDYGVLVPGSRGRLLGGTSKLGFRGAAPAYYIALASNALARGTWAQAIAPRPEDVDYQLYYALVEIARRGLWLVFRVEHEHIKTAHGRERAGTLESIDGEFLRVRGDDSESDLALDAGDLVGGW